MRQLVDFHIWRGSGYPFSATAANILQAELQGDHYWANAVTDCLDSELKTSQAIQGFFLSTKQCEKIVQLCNQQELYGTKKLFIKNILAHCSKTSE